MVFQVNSSQALTYITTAVSVLAFAMSIYTTKKTMDFNKRQNDFIETNDKLNKLLLDREQQESLVQRQADISANFIKVGSNKYRLKVFNRGKSIAHNIRIEFPTRNQVLLKHDLEEKFPMPTLEPQQSVELLAAISMNSPRRMDIKFIWDDQSAHNRDKLVTLTL